jgi:hypothetical protein
MPSLLDTTVAANYNKPRTVNGLGPKTTIVKIAKTDITTAELHTIITAITQGGVSGTNDAFTVAGVATANGAAFVSGTTDVVFLALQGTGVITADSSDAYGVTGAVSTIESVFVNPF